MRRIVDDPDQRDPTLRVAAKMIRGVDPMNDSLQRQRRVRLKLGSPSRPATIFRARPVLVVLLLSMLSVAGASAMVDGGWPGTRQRIASWVHHETPARARSLPARRSEVQAAPALSIEQAAPLPLPTAPVAIAAAGDRQAQSSPGESKRRLANRESPPAAKLASRPGSEPPPRAANLEADLMLEAIQARQAGDTRRAERLLTRCLAEFPDGALQEEALALLIEARAERDRPGAETLARIYLQRFPDGRFRERVARGLRDTTTTR